MGFTTAAVVAEQRGDIIQVTTGCKELDSILEGAPPVMCVIAYNLYVLTPLTSISD